MMPDEHENFCGSLVLNFEGLSDGDFFFNITLLCYVWSVDRTI